MITREEFEIVWNATDGQTQVPGVYVYGFFPRGLAGDIEEPFNRLVGPLHAAHQIRSIEYESGLVAKVAIRFDSLPSDDANWRAFLIESFSILLDAGATVGWAGGIDCSSSPEVLDPTSCAGNVYAAKSIESALLCNSKLNEPIQFVSDEELSVLWKVVNQG